MTRVKIVKASEDHKHYAATIYRFPENYKGFQALFNGDYSAFFLLLTFPSMLMHQILKKLRKVCQGLQCC